VAARNHTQSIIEHGLDRVRSELTSTQTRDAGMAELFESRTFQEWAARLRRLESKEIQGSAGRDGPE
jgi:hypothetical protein